MAEFAHKNGNDLNERVVTLFQPDPTVMDQYLETLRPRESLEPEKRLMLAVMEDAVNCFQKYLLARNRKSRALFREIEEWFLTEENDWIFSFESICAALGLSPEYVRKGLLRWKEKELKKRSEIKVFRPDNHTRTLRGEYEPSNSYS